jgi:hypothetical protein
MSTIAASSVPAQKAAVAARTGFFFWVSILLLAFLLAGFAPTLYLRPYFNVEPIPAYLYVHGAVLTAWYVWLVVQTSMVRAGRIATHRQLGVIGAVIGAAVVIAGPMASLGVPARVAAAGLDWYADMSVAIPDVGVEGVTVNEFIANVVWGNLASIVVFAGLLAAAILLRSNAQTHKRLIVIASMVNVLPAVARISRWPGLGGEDGLFIPAVLVGLLLSLLAYDIATRRRPHKATLIGIGVIVLAFVASQVIIGSEPGLAFIRSLG